MSENEISKSKQKRMNMENARKEQKRKKAAAATTTILILLAIIAVICLSFFIYQSSKLSYGKYLTEEGLISGVNPADYIQFDYKNLVYSESELLPDDAVVDADIASACESLATPSASASLTSASENKVVVSYTASVGGVSYNSVQEQDYTIGSGIVSDEFDESLIGHKPGDSYQIDIAYPADYYNTELAGVTVSYDVTLHSIYVTPEFTDELVAENFSDIASTAEEYRNYLIEQYRRDNLITAINNSLTNDCTLLKYPQEYLDNIEKIYLYQNEQQFNSYNEMFFSSLGYNLYSSVYEMYGYTSQAEYEAYIRTIAESDVTYYLAIMTVYAGEGMTNTRDEVLNYYYEQGYDTASFQVLEENYHYNYLAQMALANKVINYLADTVTVQ